MIHQRDNYIWFRLDGILRQAIVRKLYFPTRTHYIVNEYPKSGGTWLGQMLSEALEVPFPRNRLPMVRPCIMHGHFLNPWRLNNLVVLWRDGRDVVVSKYYHALCSQGGLNSRLVRITRRHLRFSDYGDIQSNLPRFIEYLFERKVTPRFSWADFVSQWAGGDAVYVKYEDLRKNAALELTRVVRELTGRETDQEKIARIVHKYSFENQSGRKAGDENINSFLRKGIAGDWKNHFTKESRQLFSHYAGRELITLGYEEDSSWAK